MRTIVAAIGLMALGNMPVQAGYYYGRDLQRFCDADMATPYVLGVFDALEISELAGSEIRICVPSDARGSDLVGATCSYLDGSADVLASSAALVVAAALSQAFPCT